MQNFQYKLTGLLLTSMFLVACGGTGGSSANPDAGYRGEARIQLQLIFPLLDTDADGKLEIWHPEHLVALATTSQDPTSNPISSLALNASYELTADISLSRYNNWRPIGNITHPFTGNLDGNGYSISGITTDGYDNAGLFGVIHSGSINNLTVGVATITSPLNAGSLAGMTTDSYISNVGILLGDIFVSGPNVTQAGYSSAGGMIGFARNSYISNSRISGSGSINIKSKINRLAAGGLVGYAYGGNYNNTHLDATLDINIKAQSDGHNTAVGSLIGHLNEANLIGADIFFRGSFVNNALRSSAYAGGVVGIANRCNIHYIEGAINASLSTAGYIDSYTGAFVGDINYCEASDINLHILGDLTGDGLATRRSDSNVGGVAGSGYIIEPNNINIIIDGDLMTSAMHNYIGGYMGYARYSQGVYNTSIIINGNLISKYEGDGPPSHEVGGISGYHEIIKIDNVSIEINGDIEITDSTDINVIGDPKEVYFGSFVSYSILGQMQIKNSYVLINGAVNISTIGYAIYAGGFVGFQRNGWIMENSYAQITGGMHINSSSSLAPDLDLYTSVVTGNNIYVGWLAGEQEEPFSVRNSYFAMDAPLAIYLDGVLGPQYFGGATGLNTASNDLLLDASYYNLEVLGRTPQIPNIGAAYRSYVQLRCPTSAGEDCGDQDSPSGGSLPSFNGWDESIWDFGGINDLPKIIK